MIRTVIVCDKCGTQLAWVGTLAEKYINKFSRGHGWSCGKQHLCPDCRKTVRRADHE